MTTPVSTDQDPCWAEPRAELDQELSHLVIVWSHDEPYRLGEAAPVEGRSVLGRGCPQAQDPAPRVVFRRQRPMGSVVMPPLEGQRISRIQLEIAPRHDGTVAVRSLGRCPLLINDRLSASGVVREGDVLTLQNALMMLVVRRRQSLLAPQVSMINAPRFPFGEPDPHGIVGESAASWALRGALAFAAEAGGHVLVRGESGAGKELAARAIHAMSHRSSKGFVARNAATFPEGLVDAELFGAAKDYPNAGSPERSGVIGEADGGTLFLDEIGELPHHLQAHLLRVLDRGGEYQRLGESLMRRADVRLIAATNRPLDRLRHDFAARFAIHLRVPGLAERREDIPLLVRHLLIDIARSKPNLAERYFETRSSGSSGPRVAPALISTLLHHTYTHHSRELERLLWISLSTSPGNFLALTPALAAELDAELAAKRCVVEPAADDAGKAEPPNRFRIQVALAVTGGNVTEAARRLGLRNRFILYRLMRRHGITPSAGLKEA